METGFLKWILHKAIKLGLFPFKNIELTSPLHASDIIKIVHGNIEYNPTLNFYKKESYREYEGFVNNDNFTMRRILKTGVNSFIPTAYCYISSFNNSAKLKLKIRLPKAIYLLLGVFLLFSLILISVELLSDNSGHQSAKELFESEEFKDAKQYFSDEEWDKLTKTNNTISFSWGSLFIFLAPYVLSVVAFNYESKNLLLQIKHLIEAREIE